MLALVGFMAISRWLLYVETKPWAWVHFFFCGVVGMITAYIFIVSTQVRGGRASRTFVASENFPVPAHVVWLIHSPVWFTALLCCAVLSFAITTLCNICGVR